MSPRTFRGTVSCVLVLLFPISMFAADSNAAMLYANGNAWLNGSNVPRFSAIFSGDLVQTKSESPAKINAAGSSVLVMAESLVRFDGASLNIEHGGVTVSTSKGMATTAGVVKVAPASASWTEFNVTDVDGTVRIAAKKGDVTVSDANGTVTVAQGQETTRDDADEQTDGKKKKERKHGTGAAPGAEGGMLNSPLAIEIGAGAVAGLTAWVLIKGDNPASPSAP